MNSTDPVLANQLSINSATPSPPPISIQPVSPPSSPKADGNEEEDVILISNHNHPATIAEEFVEQDELVLNKSSLSLPVEQSAITAPPSTSTPHTQAANSSSSNHIKVSLPERSQSDRRKLSVTNIMSFGERRRSTSSIFSEMRKMSITNFDNLKSPVGEITFVTLFI